MPPPPVVSFSPDDNVRIQHALNCKLDREDISYRPSAAGHVAYIEGWRSFNLANEIFGFNGWSSEILAFTTDFCEADSQGRLSIGMSCMVRVYLKDGTFHDDIGYGSSEGQKGKAAAFEKAKKEAVTDAMKRALRVYGNKLGNCAYDKVFLREVKNGPAVMKQETTSQNVVNQQQQQQQQPPSHFKPTWRSAKSALQQPPHHYHNLPHCAINGNVEGGGGGVHYSDDFDIDALITEADLYDLEQQAC